MLRVSHPTKLAPERLLSVFQMSVWKNNTRRWSVVKLLKAKLGWRQAKVLCFGTLTRKRRALCETWLYCASGLPRHWTAGLVRTPGPCGLAVRAASQLLASGRWERWAWLGGWVAGWLEAVPERLCLSRLVARFTNLRAAKPNSWDKHAENPPRGGRPACSQVSRTSNPPERSRRSESAAPRPPRAGAGLGPRPRLPVRLARSRPPARTPSAGRRAEDPGGSKL